MISKFYYFKIWSFQNLMISKIDDFRLWWFQNLIISNQENFVALPPSISSYSVDSFIFFCIWWSSMMLIVSFCKRNKNGWEIKNSDLKFRLKVSKTDHLEDAIRTGSENFLCYGLMRHAVREGFPCKFWKNKDAQFILRPIGFPAYALNDHNQEWVGK